MAILAAGRGLKRGHYGSVSQQVSVASLSSQGMEISKVL